MSASTAMTSAVSARSRGLWLLATLLVALMTLQVQGAPAARAAEPVTYAGPSYPNVGFAASADKPQSKLWYNDGSWWALMTASGGVFIHRLGADHVWRNTNALVDERIASTGDALWDGSKLHVGSRVSGGAMRVVRFSYSGGTYTRDAGYPKQIASGGTESMSIAKDSTGRLWATYTQGSPRRVYVASTATDGVTWSAPFLVPVPDNTVNSDDIAGIVAFAGRIGVMWSDQDNDVMRFAVHLDSAAPTTGWTVEDALSGPNLADDHLNLKSLQGDNSGRIFAAVKTSRGDAGEPSTDPSVVVLQRPAAGGTWARATASTVGDKLTRPQIALDSTNSRLYVLLSTESGGTVYYRSSPLSTLAFSGTAKSTPFIRATGASINDATTTKQTVNATTGLVVLATDKDAGRYYHGEMSLGGTAPADTSAPSVPTNVTGTSPSPTSVALSWTASTDNVGVTGYRVFRNGVQVGTSTTTSFTNTGLTAATTYDYSVVAVDAAGNVSAQSSPATAVTTQSGTSTDTTAPTAPTGLTGSSPSSTSVALSWTASTDNVGVTEYRVYRNGAQVGTSTSTGYTDSGLTAATTYSYTVAAVDAAGNVSPQSSPATSVTTQSGTTPPPAGSVTFVGAATATGTTTSTTVAAPADATTGDVLVAAVSTRGGPTILTPSGWTLVRQDVNSSTMRQAVFVRPATTSNGSTWTLSSAYPHVIQVLAYRGVDSASPVAAHGGAVSTTATITSPQVSALAGSRVVTFAGIARTATLAPASPLTERSEVTTTSTATYKITADAADTTTSGTTAGPYTTTASGTGGGIGQTVTFRPRA